MCIDAQKNVQRILRCINFFPKSTFALSYHITLGSAPARSYMSALTPDTEYRVVIYNLFNVNLNQCVEKIVFTDDMNGNIVRCDSF